MYQLLFDNRVNIDTIYDTNYNNRRSGSSHYTFRKPGKNPITIPKHEPIKRIYVEMVREVVEEENTNEND